MGGILKALEDAVGTEYVSEEDFVTYAYARGIDCALPANPPEYVVKPGTAEEVAEIVRIANKFKVAIVPRGGGCCLMGGSKPIEKGGIVLDIPRMRRIISIDEDTLTVTVEAGITWAELNYKLNELGYYTGNLGPGSGMSAVVGGGLSHHSAGGGGAAKYGMCTEHCVALEVVLPNGDIINTGSNASVYTKEPFCRFGFGPDLTGLFLGDNGLMGIKTKATLEIFPKPEYHVAKTFTIEEPSAENTAKIWLAWRKRGDLGIYDSAWIPLIMVLGTQLLLDVPLIKPWVGLQKAVFWYTMEAETEEQLEANVKIVDRICREHGCEDMGPKISDGNIAKWHYEEQGHWLFYHGLWGGMGPGSIPLTTEHHISIKRLPYICQKLDEWEAAHREELHANGEMQTGVSSAGLFKHATAGVASGLLAWDKPEYREKNLELWKSQIEMLLREGAMPYMTGEMFSKGLIDTGAFSETYYAFLKSVKQALDPNRIISPGKYYL
ncbi:MAG: FAD-binding oxidoreductase [Candidatus Freyarchaeota archaeon]|nr:FAD-binding oxidoreductase [Candidatus Jordarchaeia archaeon]